MDHQLVVQIIVVVQSWLVLRQDEIGLKANNVVQESSEFVNFAAHDNVWP